ncbi:PorP/SprF family type IX secretion system membrane protein [Capnocytophaga canimorsus]|uniref:PorP/SprF family type IX secretion system membrane protein n=1 Tax=Capnocytophaga canimorsus TaxID=28188 RepID=UPI000F4EA4E7|nr:PorP/SprF family type IX secretion system membrane protein [Capnocytophaga canimorsus]AYW37752.1 type IX secretion system membrane protein PorP/SprF [Capnocytophaga canimorsus]MDT9500571.1 PorP/SprF family type IX secretion system membrane protein [Capnocytophaga canimorsus]
MNKYYIILFLFLTKWSLIWAQQKGGHYFPYEMPGHSAVKFNSFLMNPAFAIMSPKETNIALYHRNQWLGHQNHFTTYSVSYGKKWSLQNMANGMLFQKKAGVFTNYGIIGNYIHQIEISDENYLRLGVNTMIGMSGLSRNDIIVNQHNDPILDNISNSGMVNIQPGFDINFGNIHFGINAENLIDYAFSASEMAVPFQEKSLVGHFMYRHEILSGYGMLEDAVFSTMLRARRTSENFQLGANAVLDMPNLGWIYAGYDRKYGIFGGLGFHVGANFSASFGYEQGIGTFANNLGGTYEVVLAYQFGGERHERAKQLKEKVKAKEREIELAKEKARREAERPKVQKEEKPVTPEAPKTAEVEKPKPPVIEKPKEIDPLKEAEVRLNVREDKVAGDKISAGYYVIVSVFRDKRNAFRYIQRLQSKGIKALGFVNPQTNMTYVYLNAPFSSLDDAGNLMINNGLPAVGESDNGIWILKVSKP